MGALRWSQRGQGAIEYVGLVVVVAAIVGALVGTGVGPALADGISTQVCKITGGGNCGGGSDTVAEDDADDADDQGGADDPASDGREGGDGGGKSQAELDYEAALKELQDAQAAEKSDSDKAKEAAKELAKILADELGITDALDCITKGDMGACTETLINVLLSIVGGAVGKLAAKYGAPWKWKKAVELVKKLKKHGGDLYDGLKGLIKNRKRVDDAEDKLADAKKRLDQENKDKPKDGDKPEDKPESCAVKHSFLPGTPVLLADGRRMAIDKLRVGMRVVATDPESGRTQARAVERTITTYDDKDFTRLTVLTDSGTDVLTATDTHPFWLTDQGRWADAGDITAGDDLRTPAGTSVQVTAVDRYTKRQTTHDLTINGIHTYYVVTGDTPVLVHNNDWCTDEERLEDAGDIANGHADSKHAKDFPGVSAKELGELATDVMKNPSRTKPLGSGRKAYLGKDGTTIVIHDPMHPDGGTIFRRDPGSLEDYWAGLD
ncbi:polymorphic toxin-type HINT domain-containing protein [Streptomyces sp. NPDC050433]|uniref:polymorphic toxin-type HINT domain-containing protein n=2 Tax=unclassified Streptomyces TaxID=2593676 RepID=UPI0037BC3F64